MKLSIYLTLFTILAISCQTKKDKVEKVIKEWQGKEILIPDGNFVYSVLGRDTFCADLWEKPYKILTYIDSIGCSACQMGLLDWRTKPGSPVGLTEQMSGCMLIEAMATLKI